jgi:hypothetical protein
VQDAIGEEHDAGEIGGLALPIGEVVLPGDVAAPAVVRSIAADYYGEQDLLDWYVVTLRDEAINASCVNYWLHLQLSLSGAAPPPGTTLGLLAGGVANSVTAPTDTSPYLIIRDLPGMTCGSTQGYYIWVRRNGPIAAPVPYTLNIRLERQFWASYVTAISPTSGPVGTAVTITGTALLPQVTFQGVAATLTSYSPTSITTSVPAGASTGPIVVGAMSTPQSFTVTTSPRIENRTSSAPAGPRTSAPNGPGAVPPVRTAPPAPPTASACCVVVPNPGLAGRLGRLVVAFPADASGTRVAVLKDGKELQGGYGNQAWDLLAGTYELSVAGKIVPNVSVQARSDTNVRVGVLRVSAGDQTRAEVLDGDVVVVGGYGTQLIGLPVGSYGLRIAGQTDSFTIEEGKITDY